MCWTLTVWDDGGGSDSFEFDEQPDVSDIYETCYDWVYDGDWGDEGASITVYWELFDDEGDFIDDGSEVIDVEPNHQALIKDATYRFGEYLGCGPSPDDHDWTAEGEGGLDENPGVWSIGGTKMVFHTHCSKCGLQRRELSVGSQRNPGEVDSVEYSWPDEDEV